MKVDIVIVNWNSGSLLSHCLQSIAVSEADLDCIGKVIIVDNASRDGSTCVDQFSSVLPLRVIRNSENHGFARACNEGAAAGRSEAILFLNPDTMITPGSVTCAVSALSASANDHVGIIGIRMLDEFGETQLCTSRFPTPWALVGRSAGLDRVFPSLSHFDRSWDHKLTRDVDQVMGAFLLCRRDLFGSLGGFDERFFVYYDDVDLCLRAQQSGWRCVYFADATIVHEGQGTTRAVKDIRLFYLLRSRLLYAAKHFGPIGLVAVGLATLCIEPIARAALLIPRGAWTDLTALTRAYRRLYASLPSIADPSRRANPVSAHQGRA